MLTFFGRVSLDVFVVLLHTKTILLMALNHMFKENRRGNQELTIQRDGKHWVQDTEQRRTKHKHNTETIKISNMDTTQNGVEPRCSRRATVPVFYKTPFVLLF